MFDCHIHMSSVVWPENLPRIFLEKSREAAVAGGAVYSPWPEKYQRKDEDQRWETRLESVFRFTAATPGFLPVFFLDPTEPDALTQVKTAAEQGIAAFKIICNHFYPREILPVLSAIAACGCPVIFHSGILYNWNSASDYNQPRSFECLLQIAGLRFLMAHVAWPWTDEMIALYGEFAWAEAAYPGKSSRMYLDLTPGTPLVFRRDMLRRLFLTGYSELENRVLWGSDTITDNYSSASVQFRSAADRKYFEEISASTADYRITAARYQALWRKVTEENQKTFFCRPGTR